MEGSIIESRVSSILESTEEWMDVASIVNMLKGRGEGASYNSVKAALLRVAARGEVLSKKVGYGRRGVWIFHTKEGGIKGAQKAPVKALVMKVETDPFEINPDERDTYTVDQIVALYESLYARYSTLIKDCFKRTDERYIVLCNGGLVLTSNDPTGPSNEQLKAIERRFGKACYVIGADVIEEAAWSDLGDGDFYPTLPIVLGREEWEEEELFKDGLHIVADFDTGNPDVSAFSIDELTTIHVLAPTAAEIRSDIHLGKHLYYAWRWLKIGIDDFTRRRYVRKPCKCVLYWNDKRWNPFLLANQGRRGFIGRDLVFLFPLEITLNPLQKVSRVHLL